MSGSVILVDEEPPTLLLERMESLALDLNPTPTTFNERVLSFYHVTAPTLNHIFMEAKIVPAPHSTEVMSASTAFLQMIETIKATPNAVVHVWGCKPGDVTPNTKSAVIYTNKISDPVVAMQYIDACKAIFMEEEDAHIDLGMTYTWIHKNYIPMIRKLLGEWNDTTHWRPVYAGIENPQMIPLELEQDIHSAFAHGESIAFYVSDMVITMGAQTARQVTMPELFPNINTVSIKGESVLFTLHRITKI